MSEDEEGTSEAGLRGGRGHGKVAMGQEPRGESEDWLKTGSEGTDGRGGLQKNGGAETKSKICARIPTWKVLLVSGLPFAITEFEIEHEISTQRHLRRFCILRG